MGIHGMEGCAIGVRSIMQEESVSLPVGRHNRSDVTIIAAVYLVGYALFTGCIARSGIIPGPRRTVTAL